MTADILINGFKTAGQLTVNSIGVLCLVAAVEMALPSRKAYPASARLKAFTFAAVNFAIGVTLIGPLHELWKSLGVHQALVVDLLSPFKWAGPAAVVLAGIATAMFVDLFGYWFHRAQHAVPFLWRFHAVHHSIEELHAASNYIHPADGLFQLVLMTIPMSLFPVDRGATPFFVLLPLALQPYFIHSPTKLSIGPLRWIFADNRFHRIHHSTQVEHYDRNFGTMTPLWDFLFGTGYWPRGDEWPETGLRDQAEPANVWEYLTAPISPPPPRTTRTAGVAAE